MVRDLSLLTPDPIILVFECEAGPRDSAMIIAKKGDFNLIS